MKPYQASGAAYVKDKYLPYRFLSTVNSIDGQSPNTTTETNPVWWQIELGSLQRGFARLFEAS